MGVAGPQHGGDELPGLAVEDQQGMIHGLPKVAVIGAAVLLAVGRVVSTVQVQHDPPRHPRPLPFSQVDLAQGLRQTVTIPRREGILPPREGRLAGQVGGGLRQAAADQLQQRIAAQRIGIVLVFVASGDLVDALAQQLQRRVAAAPPPVRTRHGQRGAQSQRRIRFGDPGPAAITAQPATPEIDCQRRGHGRSEDAWRRGSLVHAGHLLVAVGQHLYRYQMGASLSLMNNPG